MKDIVKTKKPLLDADFITVAEKVKKVADENNIYIDHVVAGKIVAAITGYNVSNGGSIKWANNSDRSSLAYNRFLKLMKEVVPPSQKLKGVTKPITSNNDSDISYHYRFTRKFNTLLRLCR
jgi:hypothetical protein